VQPAFVARSPPPIAAGGDLNRTHCARIPRASLAHRVREFYEGRIMPRCPLLITLLFAFQASLNAGCSEDAPQPARAARADGAAVPTREVADASIDPASPMARTPDACGCEEEGDGGAEDASGEVPVTDAGAPDGGPPDAASPSADVDGTNPTDNTRHLRCASLTR
jgi:hypothetical protein